MLDSRLLSHVYDPAKAHAYYEAHKKLQGRQKKGDDKKSTDSKSSTGPTRKHRAVALGNKAAENLGPERARAVRRLVNQTKTRLDKLTDEFRTWVSTHPKASVKEKEAQRDVVLGKKDEAIKNFKAEVAKITASSKVKPTTPSTATEGRHN